MSDEVLRWLTSLGVAGVLLALVNGFFAKRKLSAEATQIITEAASGTLKDVRDENTRLIGRLTAAETRLDAVERENQRQSDHLRQTDALITVHGEWDRQAYFAAKSRGIQLPEPPPLSIGANQ